MNDEEKERLMETQRFLIAQYEQGEQVEEIARKSGWGLQRVRALLEMWGVLKVEDARRLEVLLRKSRREPTTRIATDIKISLNEILNERKKELGMTKSEAISAAVEEFLRKRGLLDPE